MDAVEGLLEFVIGPAIGHEDDVVGEVEAVAFGHAFDAGEQDGDGVGGGAALLEGGGLGAAGGLAGAAVEEGVADAGFVEPAGEVVQRIVEGAEDDGLFAAFEDLGEQG